MRTIDIHEAKANLFRLIEQASQGASFLIAISGTPRVMVTPVDASDVRQTKRVGFLHGAVCVPEDFDQMGQAHIEGLFGGS